MFAISLQWSITQPVATSPTLLTLWLSTEAVAFSPRPHPYLPALLPCLVRDSLCTALQTKILWINWSLNAIDTIETWVSGNLTALTERSQPAIQWHVGEVANRVSCGSFRGGHWYLPIRNHDNRYFADWIRLCPGLSNNSENGNSCPKPHKAARMIEAVGRAVSIETETIIAIWILPRRSSRFYKGKLIKWRPKLSKWTESSLQKLECLLAPKTKQSYLFLALIQWPWQGCCWNLPRECNAVRRSCVPPPPYRHYRHCPAPPPTPPPTIRLCSLRSAGLVKRVWPAPDQWLRDQMAACWAGFTSPVAMSCMCFCVAEVFFLFSHCTPQGP